MEPEIVAGFLQQITDLIVELSRVQMERIGLELLAQPGHIMPSVVGGPGISVSDDNLAVSSPRINRLFALPLDEQLGEHFGGLAIHSCGVWTHTMSMLRETYRRLRPLNSRWDTAEATTILTPTRPPTSGGPSATRL